MAFAHSVNAAGHRHDLVDHLRSVAAIARDFAGGIDAAELAYYAGLWHDVGKFHPAFQDYLLRCEDNPKARGRGPDHKAAGAALAMRHLHFLSLLIQGHHGGLRSPVDKDAWLNEKLSSGAAEESLALAGKALPDLEPSTPLLPPSYVLRDREAAEMFLRLVFSALADADFLDTERHFKAEQAIARSSSVSLSDLWPVVEAAQETLISSAGGSTVNDVRRAVYRHCVEAAEGAPGFYKLTVPTGGGKTRSGMAFALRHARKHGLERVVVAVPFISITEQTASVYRDLFGAVGRGAVLEHHSMAEWDEDDDGDFHSGPVWDRLAAENWDAPVVVTTTVQLFESLFSNRTSRTRKLHRLAHSVIILDEAQALPARLLTPILHALRQLVEHCGTTVVLSTATQPAFDAIPAFVATATTEIVPQPERFFSTLQRVDYEWRIEAPLPPGEAADLLRAQPQSLAVLNTKKDALALLDAVDPVARPTVNWRTGWDQLLEEALAEADALHLSTLLCGAHRRDVLAEIKRRLSLGLPCHVISTQVIEAGVDLDFPFVMRALGPLDAIIQAAGRCNREGRLEKGKVVVYEPEGGGIPQGAYRSGADVTRSLLRAGGLDPGTPEAARRYYKSLFGLIDPDAENIQRSRGVFNYPAVARDFRMIDDDIYSAVVTTYGSAEERTRLDNVLAELRGGTARAREQRRLLQPYVVGLRSRRAEQLRRDGLIEEVRPGYGIWLGGYDAVRGLVSNVMEPDALVI